MAKAKRRQLAALDAKNDISAGNSLSNSRMKVEDTEKDGWVVVKKQRIIILVPALPKPMNEPSPQNPRMKKQTQDRSRKTAEESRARILSKQCLRGSGSREKKTLLGSSEEDIQTDKCITKAPQTRIVDAPPDPSTAPKECWDQLANKSILEPCSVRIREGNQQSLRDPGTLADGSRALEVASRFSNGQPFSAIGPSRIYRDREICEFGLVRGVNVGALQNQSVRAFNLERKLKRAGGLSRWLLSQGLDRFVEIFKREKIDEFELLGLTMSRLKDMGADAVGPRRKLMHAIDCLCQPYYFRTFSSQ